MKILQAVHDVNVAQPPRFVSKIIRHFGEP